MIVLFTDFGLSGPYVGQMKARIHDIAPALPVIDLFADAPAHNIRASSYLLAAYAQAFPVDTVFLAVVDPGVGSARRLPVALQCDGRWFVGPGNGLFDVVGKRARRCEQWVIRWRPAVLSSSFHGRDLFAPVAAMLATGRPPELEPMAVELDELARLPEELEEIVYIDHFGNLLSGIRAAAVAQGASLAYQGQAIPPRQTFVDVAPGSPLCYENANGLLEIAVNQGRAVDYFGAQIGDRLALVAPVG
ncbi:MAG: SAM-dependent chlorinase/fluorinase [Gammaproteobacteria bacterium]|nr:SAM-dependent chlorinase/fluorinase [Gammaproteobacteria bacterium]